MKLLNSMGPNPRMVRMFMIEKGIELETLEHDILGAENRRSPYTDKNPGGQIRPWNSMTARFWQRQ